MVVSPVVPADEQLSILTVHAHPDDEASKGPGTIRRYANEGIRTTLVCCTGGEEGDILNPAMERPDVVDNLGAVRRAELDASANIIGYDQVVMLGYRDSGMPDSEANARPEAFANADVNEAAGRLVKIIRTVRPQVVVTYPLVQNRYPHPDHKKVTAITLPAFARAGDPNWYPELGAPFTPTKLYAPIWSKARLTRTHEKFLELGLESPFDAKWLSGRDRDDRVTARLAIEPWVGRKSLMAHATQVDPESPFWFGLPDDVLDTLYPYDEYMLIESRIKTTPIEDDLFAGLRVAPSGANSR